MIKPIPTEEDAPHNCPHCTITLLGDVIPEDIREHYAGNYWKREIGIVDLNKYDGVYYYECPDCKGQWGGYRSLKEG